MSVERDQAERIAALARLHFGPGELERLTEELNHILDHVEALKSLEATDSGSGAGDDPQEWNRGSTRGDGAEFPDELDADLSSLAPAWQDGFFVVPPLPGMHEDGPD